MGLLAMTRSKVSIDPIPGVMNARGYNVAVDTSKPIEEESQSYKIISTVTIAGTCAYVGATLGDMKDKDMLEDFDNELRKKGVKSIHYERHEHGRTDKYKRDI
jgi:hypothetical protein